MSQIFMRGGLTRTSLEGGVVEYARCSSGEDRRVLHRMGWAWLNMADIRVGRIDGLI